MATKKEIAKSGELPSYLAKMAQGPIDTGDNFDASDIAIPRVKLLQALSKECEAFDEAKSGIFWHTGLDRPIGTEFEFVICSRRKKYLLAAPLEDGQGILARADDFENWNRTGEWEVKIKGKKEPVTWKIEDTNVAKSGLDQWGTFDPDDDQSPPAATLFYDYLVLLPEHMDLGPTVLTLTRSQIKKARKGLNDKITLHTNAGRPMQALMFKAGCINDTNANNQDFKNYQFTGAGFAPEELYERAKEFSNLLSEFKVANEEDSLNEHAESDGDGNADSDKF